MNIISPVSGISQHKLTIFDTVVTFFVVLILFGNQLFTLEAIAAFIKLLYSSLQGKSEIHMAELLDIISALISMGVGGIFIITSTPLTFARTSLNSEKSLKWNVVFKS
jgi:hypothetical protein